MLYCMYCGTYCGMYCYMYYGIARCTTSLLCRRTTARGWQFLTPCAAFMLDGHDWTDAVRVARMSVFISMAALIGKAFKKAGRS